MNFRYSLFRYLLLIVPIALIGGATLVLIGKVTGFDLFDEYSALPPSSHETDVYP